MQSSIYQVLKFKILLLVLCYREGLPRGFCTLKINSRSWEISEKEQNKSLEFWSLKKVLGRRLIVGTLVTETWIESFVGGKRSIDSRGIVGSCKFFYGKLGFI